MQKAKRTIDYTIASSPTLADLRRIVKETETIDEKSRVEFPREQGQRDAEYVHVVITEEFPNA